MDERFTKNIEQYDEGLVQFMFRPWHFMLNRLKTIKRELINERGRLDSGIINCCLEVLWSRRLVLLFIRFFIKN